MLIPRLSRFQDEFPDIAFHVETSQTPDPTGASEWDANVAARLLYKLIGFAVK